jgi:FtsZ-binding cell division protein ZapB
MSEKAVEAVALDFQIPDEREGFEVLDHLEKKVSLAIAQIKSLRVENAKLRDENSDLERRVSDQNVQLKDLRGKFARLEGDRVNVKSRVQRLIQQVDAISAADDE